MDFFKSQLTRLQQQVAALSASQKMLAAALVVIMVMTLAWSGKYAGQAEMEDVLSKDFAPEEAGLVTSLLAAKNVPYKVNGSRIQVPADRKSEAFAYISFAQILPHDTSGAFEDILNKMSSPIDSPSKTDMIQNHARGAALAQIIRYFPKVRSAMVTIDPTMKRGFGSEAVTPSATVSIQLKPGEKFDKRLVEAAADVVSGGVAAIERKKIKVIVDGASHAIDDPEDGGFGGGSLLDRLREFETYESRRVQDHIGYIEGAMVHVTATINDEKKEIEDVTYDAKGTVKVETSSKTHTEEMVNISNRSAGDPGVNANTGLSVQSPGAGAAATGDKQQSTTEDGQSTTVAHVPTKKTLTQIRPGQATVKGASVALPRSYFVKIYQRVYQTDKEPQDSVLMPFIDKQLPGIRSQVRRCLDVPSDDVIVVDTYTDLMPVVTDNSTQAVGGVSMLLSGHVKEIALGALALISLFMVSMLVRKSGPAVAVLDGAADTTTAAGAAAAAKAGGKSGKALKPGEEAAEVAEGVSSLDGVELDNEAVRGQQMLDQVSTLVKENPDAAANLVKRWMNRA